MDRQHREPFLGAKFSDMDPTSPAREYIATILGQKLVQRRFNVTRGIAVKEVSLHR